MNTPEKIITGRYHQKKKMQFLNTREIKDLATLYICQMIILVIPGGLKF